MEKDYLYFDIDKEGYCGYHKRNQIGRMQVKMKDGRILSLFVNKKDGLIVGDMVDKDGKGGYEFLRMRTASIPTSKARLQDVV